MAAQPFDHIDRQMKRAGEIADEAMAAPEGERTGLKGLSPEMLAEVESWGAVQKLVKAQERAEVREGEEAVTAMVALKSLYEELLPLAQHKAGFDGSAPSEYSTDDDFTTAEEEMEEVFRENAEQKWASEPLAKLTEVGDAAAKEYAEAVSAGRALQKAQAKRAKIAEEGRSILVPFRRCVRGTFGASSKEYRDLLDRQYRKKSGPDPTPQ